MTAFPSAWFKMPVGSIVGQGNNWAVLGHHTGLGFCYRTVYDNLDKDAAEEVSRELCGEPAGPNKDEILLRTKLRQTKDNFRANIQGEWILEELRADQ